MTVLNSGISWCTGTLNLSVGCTQIPVPGGSACDNCYAKVWVNRGMHGSRDFGTVRLFPERLRDLRKFAPAIGDDGAMTPKMIFVNSLSDFWHDQIPDKFIHDALDAFEGFPEIIMQILTKRPVRMRKIIEERYLGGGVPQNIWLGVSAESNAVKARLNILRRLKDRVGDFTAFVSVEPIFAPTDELDFTGMNWILTGGESGPKARDMDFAHLATVNDKALDSGIALHFKQYGKPQNNPLVAERAAGYERGGRQVAMHGVFVPGHIARAFKEVKAEGLELAPDEKGGATYRGRVIQEKPPHYHALKARLNPQRSLLA